MRFRIRFITGFALLFLVLGLIMALSGNDAFVGKRTFFIMVGILGWFIGNVLLDMERRLDALERTEAPGQAGSAKQDAPAT